MADAAESARSEVGSPRWLGAVLAGGRSSRFGADKTRALVGGVPLVERVRAVLASVVGEVVIVGGSGSQVSEPEPGGGPLQAVIAALAEAERRGSEGAIIVACDLPLLDRATVERLAQELPAGIAARVPRVDGHLQVLAAAWSAVALEPLRDAWDAGERSLVRAIARLTIEVDDAFDARALADADTREELTRLVRLAGQPVVDVIVRRWAGVGGAQAAVEAVADRVAREEPLEIVVDGEALAVLLRTPSGVEDDLALAAGFLLSEGVIERRDDLDGLAPCLDPAAEHRDNRVLVRLAPGVALPESARRVFVTGASCGLCGKTAIDSLRQRLPARALAAAPMASAVNAMDAAVRARQAGWASTGALHAAALFAGTSLLDVAEDVGRHNAVDKVFGRALRGGRLPLAGHALWVSGRVSFELAQKALIAGVDALIAVGAPTSLAVELAGEGGLHLIGFARGGRFNVYAGAVEDA